MGHMCVHLERTQYFKKHSLASKSMMLHAYVERVPVLYILHYNCRILTQLSDLLGSQVFFVLV